MACASFMHGQPSGKVSHPTPLSTPLSNCVLWELGWTAFGALLAQACLLHEEHCSMGNAYALDSQRVMTLGPGEMPLRT